MAAESAGATMAKATRGSLRKRPACAPCGLLATRSGASPRDGHGNGRERLDAIEYAVTMAADKSAPTTDESWTLADCPSQAVEALEVRYERDDPISGQRTGLKDLDESSAGLQGGDLIIIAGRPSMGKTAIAMNIAEHNGGRRAKAGGRVLVGDGPAAPADRMLASVGRSTSGESARETA